MRKNILLPVIFISLMSPAVLAADQSNASTYGGAMSSSDTSTSSSSSASDQQTDAIAIIINDHSYIRKMFGKIDQEMNSNFDAAQSDFNTLKDFLVKHETMEQKAFYSAIENKDDLKNIIKHLKKEEDAAANELKKFDNIKDKQEWISKYNKLKKDVDAHASEEETKLFPKVKKVVSSDELNKIGQKMMQYRKDNNMKMDASMQ